MSSAQDRIAAYRAGFDHSDHLHINSAGVSPMCVPAAVAIAACAEQMQRLGTHAFGDTLKAYEASRGLVADLLGTRPVEDGGARITMMQTCAAAISQVAFGLDLRAGDTIVTWEQEYGSNAYPWLRAAERAGGHVVRIPSEPDWSVNTARLLEAIDADTRVVAVSWVQFSTGAMTDIAAVAKRAHEVGAIIVVDAIQGVGMVEMQMDAWGIDAVCGGTHKWLCGPVGHGYLALTPELHATLTPVLQGAMTYGFPGETVFPDRPPRTDAQRFEPGTPLMLGAAGLSGAVRHTLDAGVATLNAAALKLSALVADGARQRGAEVLSDTTSEVRSPIVTFVPRGDLAPLAKRLNDGGVAFAERAGGLRISPHAFNLPSDIERFWSLYDG